METPAAIKPEGGFQFISVVHLCTLWTAYQTGTVRLHDVRVWFAAQELTARRCQLPAGKHAHYTEEEVWRLVGGSETPRSSLHRLETAGLLRWEPQRITFPVSAQPGAQSAEVTAMLAHITNQQRRIPVPRRMLRFLAGGCTKGLIATLLGHFLRCLYYRQGECRPVGLCKASWIAETFDVSLRTVKHSRGHLERLGLLQRSETPQWVLNRYGQRIGINLQWQEPRIDASVPLPLSPAPSLPVSPAPYAIDMPPVPAAEFAPLPPQSSAEFAPLDSHRELSQREEENQKPATRGGAGVLSAMFLKTQADIKAGVLTRSEIDAVLNPTVSAPLNEQQATPGEKTVPASLETSPVTTPVSASPQPRMKSASEAKPTAVPPQRPPTLQNISEADLRDLDRLLTLHTQAIQAKLIGPSEADRLTFVGLAQHVLSYRPKNAGGLFHRLLTKRHFHFVTQHDEDTAMQRLKRYLYGRVERTEGNAAVTDRSEAEHIDSTAEILRQLQTG